MRYPKPLACALAASGLYAVVAHGADAFFFLKAVPPEHGKIGSEYFSCDVTGYDCVGKVPSGETKQIDTYPDDGYSFSAWGGDCAGQTDDTCTLTFASDHTISATFTKTGPPAPPAPPPPPPPDANLLYNPGFESGSVSGWDFWSDNALSGVDSKGPHSGAFQSVIWGKSLATGTSPHFRGMLSQNLAVPDGNYAVSCWIHGEATNNLSLFVKDYSLTSKDEQKWAAAPHGSTYQLVTISPVPVTSGQITIAVYIDGMGQDWANADDCRVEPN